MFFDVMVLTIHVLLNMESLSLLLLLLSCSSSSSRLRESIGRSLIPHDAGFRRPN
jgi:hypothetical protein